MNIKELSVTATLSEEDQIKIAQKVADFLTPILFRLQPSHTEPCPDQEEPISKKEACKYYGCSEPTMTKYMAGGLVPFRRKGRRVYFFKSELREALDTPISRRL
jgi:predicted DNA-binding transcriptional regulator AlpA